MMGDVHDMKPPTLPSPAEVPSPGTATPTSHRHPSQSSSPRSLPNINPPQSGNSNGGVESEDSLPNPEASSSSARQEQSANHGVKGDMDAGKEDPETQSQKLQTLQNLRRQMEDLLAGQQLQLPNSNTPSMAKNIPVSRTESNPHDSIKKRRISGAKPSASQTDSTGSGATIIANDSSQTSENSFGQQSSQWAYTGASGRHTSDYALAQNRLKLVLPAEKSGTTSNPTGDPERISSTMKTPTANHVFLPPNSKPVVEDPVYPSPNLYDLTLRLNADPGLDAWWPNVVSILQTHYGAERVSLAVPGDATDLENVPWGQKAVFNDHLTEVLHGTLPEASAEADNIRKGSVCLSAKEHIASDSHGKDGSSRRPTIISRHSFSGFGKDGKGGALRGSERSHKPSKVKFSDGDDQRVPSPAETQADAEKGHSSQNTSTHQAHDFASSDRPGDNIRQAVFPISRPLEIEADPLIKRTGVVQLFGRTKPVVLTREYSQQPIGSSKSDAGDNDETPDEKIQVTPTQPLTLSSRPRSASTLSASRYRMHINSTVRVSDEYEQVAPSPWAQSPAPSPAPRAHAEQNPFFSNHMVDETAFAKHPPAHDYSKREPLEAIGVDMAKSVVHIPLLHAGGAKQTSPSTLRFPVAVISILSPINPYPSNLRQSLSYLMPQLTTSFCLAQHYSQLERQFASRMETPRYGRLLGLGGTFSDESSELELVAGLSGHVNYPLGDEGSLSARASIASPDEKPNSTKLSPSASRLGTPKLDLHTAESGGANAGDSPGARPGNEVDSYFNYQQSKNPREVPTQSRSRRGKTKNAESSIPSSPGKALRRSSAEEEAPSHDPATAASPRQEPRTPTVRSPSHNLPRHQSTNSLYAQLQRELPRPFSDTVAQLMLNSVPLHLFLAKPQSGEVIWTNSKFDAYRRSQPQEQRLRDPWQNIHNSERGQVSREWANALRTGSQFTERVRVKRFNDESAYRWFIFRANPLLSATGEVLYWIGSFLDIHEQHIAELKATQEREKFATDAKYRAFSNSIPQVVFEAAEYRGLIFANEQWHLYTGQKLQEAMNFGFAKHLHPDDLQKTGFLSHQLTESHLSPNEPSSESATGSTTPPETNVGIGVTPALDELVRRGVVSMQRDENGRVFYSTEIRLRSKGGDFRWHLVRLVRVETSSFGSGENSWYGTCTDINDRKNLERELNKAMQQLNMQMESKTKFFSNMSHEIRTPLNGILGTIPFILDTPLDTDQRRMLDTIQNSSTNLRELVDNILDVSRVEAGKMSLVNSWFHVRSVIEDVIDTVASRAIDKGLEINYLMDVDVPAMVVGDRFRVRQVLINLVGNAVKFTAQGEIHIRCSVYRTSTAVLKATEFLLNFDVVDTGKGFSARDAERLMQRFSQLGQSGSQQSAGSGLGLFLSKQLVEMHGGWLTPSGREGQGAKFSFFVKVDVPPPPTPEEPRPIQEELQRAAQSKLSPLQKGLAEGSSDPKFEASDISSPLEAPLPSASFSAQSSALPTPDVHTADQVVKMEATPAPTQARVPNQFGPTEPLNGKTESQTSRQVVSTESRDPQMATPVSPANVASQAKDPYSIMILCPLEYARAAIKQHIEQVVPYEVPYSVTSVPDVEDWRDMVNDGSCARLTHLVFNVLNVDDGLEVIQYISEYDPDNAPTLVVILDLYQKRQINPKIKELLATGRRVYTVPKPIKPSAFSVIFDPGNQRDLSKDRNRDVARETNNNFKTMSKMVKEVIGNKGYRILLVEDDETNRMV